MYLFVLIWGYQDFITRSYYFVFIPMHRAWSVWVTSIAAFFLTVILVVTSGPAQETANSSSSVARRSETSAGRSSFSPAGFNQGADEATRRGNADLTANASSSGQNNSQNSSQSSAENTAFVENTIGYQPREVVRLADPSNYGDRVNKDASGNPVDNDYIVVLHETVGSADSALNTFQVHHPNDNDQVSYHTLITLDGTVIYVVPPEKRAFGAGNSAFKSYSGEEAVFTNPDFPSSVNNFAYHISLETPPTGRNNASPTHSGYTEEQYQSLAWLLARTNIPDDRITTHRLVDRSQSRSDPRSFEADRMFRLLRQYPSRRGAQ